MWDRWWAAVKDVALTGTGLVVIVTQVFSAHPSDILLVTGLALTVPSAASHASTLLSGSTGQPSSRSSRRPGSSRSSSSREEDSGE
ncbi:MAG: hypothetical protein J2P30_00545 [Actinobacteria bacterium]|nr:hypothetical protein [Actinomycetota bacterium]